ncbi:sensor histidine kinase [Fibrella forsythiae]|uniref:histidine kinase n=1 Tax=Fibrella forsythiae TaxID=2817061 RepID=A0ABS3JB13_9BACT|nr:sensor histidine kinase [Fibrella forsythiae]MBO0947179.1 histidine kinase [Fibrella forsythiae]
MSNILLLVCSLIYLSLLFAVAYWAENRGKSKRSVANNPYIYALSLAVYCTAWTFYGSVGLAASKGMEFLAMYIGPTITAPIWWILLRKMIRICNGQRITSIADFISARYGKSRTLGVLVTAICVVGLIPYISIQLKAIAGSFSLLTGQVTGRSGSFINDKAFYITLLLAVFTVLFGTRKLEATERHEGLVTAVAFESIVKLIAFLAVGIFVTFGLFNGPADIFRHASQQAVLKQEFTTGAGHTTADWFWYSLLSAIAILFLPRQFQVAVVENSDERHVSKAMWLFPLYMLLINLFVIPVAFGGKLLLNAASFDADGYVLTLPLQYGQQGLALLAYLGGFSAATSMIIVETIALSVMISNNVVMPLLVGVPRWNIWFGTASSRFVINVRRMAILSLLLLAYWYYRSVSSHFSLVSVGTISFVAVAQFTPAMIGGLFWKQGGKSGAMTGLVAGLVIWLYTLILPTLVPVGWIPASWLTVGPAGLGWLNPQALMGLSKFDPIAHSFFWSLLFNSLGYVWGSVSRSQPMLEQQQAVLFVDVFKYRSQGKDSQIVWKGKARLSDLRGLLASFFGTDHAQRVLKRYARRNRINEQQTPADPRFVAYTERLLSGAIGTASARIAVASITQEDPIASNEVIQILKESQALVSVNKELQRLTRELSDANEQLKTADRQKDDFVSTITHEIRTPITSIRALVELMHDTPDMDRDTQTHFLGTVIKESERLTRLINQVLDLERMESGRYRFVQEEASIDELVSDAVEAVRPLAVEKTVRIDTYLNCKATNVYVDRDRLMQALINLLANAVKFAPTVSGWVVVRSDCEAGTCEVSINDNGMGIDPKFHELIFEKYRQGQTSEREGTTTSLHKPTGSGLGLAIAKRIVELHGGQISVHSLPGEGATFSFQIPVASSANQH